jgi:hypothetical protein
MIYLIILAYIGNVFLNRWLNYKLDSSTRMIGLWFISLIGTIPLLFCLLLQSKLFDWFIGKHWKL